MPLSALLYFYGRRLRTHPAQEALAGLGIAVGVALVFAVLVATSSVTSGSAQIVKSVVGAANLQLRARGTSGFDERLAERVAALPGVRAAVPVIDLPATAVGPNGRLLTVQLASSQLPLAGAGELGPSGGAPRSELQSVVLPAETARLLGVAGPVAAGLPAAPRTVTLVVRGRAAAVRVSAVLGPETVGPLANAIAVLAPFRSVQAMAGLPGRITRVLVESEPGAEQRVVGELRTLGHDRLTVAPATQDVGLLEQATAPGRQATGFFAFVSAIVGVLLAFSAMLLSVPERRRMIADLRIQGTRPRDLVKLLLFQALCLGVAASVVGVLLGDLLSRSVFNETPGYLAGAFALGTQTVIGWQPVVWSIAGGAAATCLAIAPPLLDLRRSRAVDAVYFEEGEPGHALDMRFRVWLFVGALALLGASWLALLVFGPAAALGVLVALALVLAIPLSFTLVVAAAQLVAGRARGLNMLVMATRALRATTARSLALAATGAVAVFGNIAVEGAHADLLDGLYADYAQYVSTADLWIANPRDDLATRTFPARGLPARIAHVPGVAAVRTYQGGFLDLLGRRVWVIARSPDARTMFPPSQIVSGDPQLAQARMRAGGWITLSEQVARAASVKLGDTVTLPTPSGPVGYRLAATTTNLGWTGGALVLSDADYRRAWASADPSALEVDLRPGASPVAVERRTRALLAPSSGLVVQTTAARARHADALAREGLSRLSEIAVLLRVAAALAMAAAMGASIWQRRRSLASLRIQSFRPLQVHAILLCESALVLITGAVIGAAAGIYGHSLFDRYLRDATGFPAPFSTGAPQILTTVAIVVGTALVALAIPGVFASRAPARLALQE
jgi:putative ABC transport system permease protein